MWYVDGVCHVIAGQRQITIKGSVARVTWVRDRFRNVGTAPCLWNGMKVETWNLVCGITAWDTSLQATNCPQTMLGRGQEICQQLVANVHVGSAANISSWLDYTARPTIPHSAENCLQSCQIYMNLYSSSINDSKNRRDRDERNDT